MNQRAQTLARLLAAGLAIHALAGAALAAAQVFPARALFSLDGDVAGAQLGSTVAGIGDFNADGRPDYAIAEPNWGPVSADATGRVLIYFGDSPPHTAPDLILTGAAAGHRFGTVVTAVGDVNGDGFTDLLVTAPGWPRPNSREGSGRAWIWYGGPHPDAIPDHTIPAVQDPGFGYVFLGMGVSASGVGDVDGDGFDDWAIACQNATVGGAMWKVFYGGNPPSRISGSFPFVVYVSPLTLCGVGDVNADGHPDLAVAYVTPAGRTGSWVNIVTDVEAGAALQVGSLATGLGTSMVPLGGGVFAAGQVTPTGGSVHVLSSSLVDQVVAAGADSFGIAIAAGNFEGDGAIELAVGAPSDDHNGVNAGAIVCLSSGRVTRGSPGGMLGLSLANAGDVDGNGADDLLAGAPLSGALAARGGRATLYSFSSYTLLSPVGPADLPAGGSAEVHWLGDAPARIDVSVDDGLHWSTAAAGVGGAAENRTTIALPDVLTSRFRLRVKRADGASGPLAFDESDHTISLTRPVARFALATRAEALPSIEAGGQLGSVIASGGDFDGDGLADVAIGAPRPGSGGRGPGRVWLARGVAGGAPALFAGEQPGEFFGAAVALARTGGELVVGAPHFAGSAGEVGRAYLYRRGVAAPWTAEGDTVGERFGSAVAWLGDWNADGVPEFAVSAPVSPAAGRTGTGRVSIFAADGVSGAAPIAVLSPAHGVSDFGSAIAAGDWNADGVPDLAVASILSASGYGRVSIYFGGPRVGTKPDLEIYSPASFEDFGAALASGDVNGDGIDDLLIGAPDAITSRGACGRVDLFLGGPRPAATPARSWEGAAPGERFGAALCISPGRDLDGGTWFLVGAPGAESNRGACRAIRGSGAGPEWQGEAQDCFGSAIGWLPDDGGSGAFVVGSPLAQTYGGDLTRITTPRYVLTSPAAGASWFGGGEYEVRWRGAEPAEVELSVDAGRSWTSLASGAGGADENSFVVRAPATASDSARIRVRPSTAGVAGEAVLPLTISTSGALQSFTLALEADGVKLAWQALPGVGPNGWSGYRVYGARADGSLGEPVTPEPITASELLIPTTRRGETYVLVALDSFGGAHELGRVIVPPADPRLRAWPQPSDERGAIHLAMFPPVDAAGRTPVDLVVRIFDVRGRLVRSFRPAAQPTRVGELALDWDRALASGRQAEAGVYFVRAEAPSAAWKLERRIVVLQ